MSNRSTRVTTPWDYDSPRLNYRHRIIGYWHELRSLYRAGQAKLEKNYNPPKTRFVIFGRGRSGSTLMVRYLDQHSQINCLGEILRGKMVWPSAHRDRCLNIGSKPVRGFKLLSYQLTQVHGKAPNSEHLKRMEDEGFRIIYLKRNNYLRLAISNMYARLRGEFHQEASSGQVSKGSYVFPYDDLLAWMEGAERRTEEESAMLDGVDYLEVVYETDLEDHDRHGETLEKVYQKLGVSPEPVNVALNKITPQHLREFVENYDEIAGRLAGTRFERFLEAD